MAGGDGATPLARGFAGAPLLPFDVEPLVAAVGHHGPKTVVGSARIAVRDAWWLSTPHRDALDGQGGRAPLATSHTFNLCRGVQDEAFHALEAHN